MLSSLRKINTNLSLIQSLQKKIAKIISFLKKKKLLTTVIVISAIALGYFGYQKLRPKNIEEQFKLSTVSRRDLTQVVEASGIVESETEVDLKFQASGQMNWVGVKKGDQVNQWQAIASLDNRELEKNLQKYLRDYSKERNDFEETIQVTYQDIVLTDTIKRILEKNQWDLDKAVLDVELKDIALKFSTLISPIKGMITHIDVPVAGVNITPATAIFTIADPDNLIFEAEVDETDIGQVMIGQTAKLILDAYPEDELTLMVDYIDFSASSADGSTVFLVKLKLNNTETPKVRLGMNGEITIITATREKVVTVPIESIIEDDVSIIKVVKDNQIVDQPVTVGLVTDSYAEIINGLEENQTIVVREL